VSLPLWKHVDVLKIYIYVKEGKHLGWDRGYSMLGLGNSGYGGFFNMWKHLNVGFGKGVVFKLKLI